MEEGSKRGGVGAVVVVEGVTLDSGRGKRRLFKTKGDKVSSKGVFEGQGARDP